MYQSNNSKKEEGKLRAIAGGALSLTVSTIIVKVLGLIYKLPLARVLGDEGLGYFSAAYAVFSFFYVISVSGIPKAVSILCSKDNNLPDNKYKILKISFDFSFAVGMTLSVLLTVLSSPISKAVGSPHCRAALLAIAPSILLVSVSGVLRGFLTAEKKLYAIAFSSIAEGAARLILGLRLAFLSASRGATPDTVSAYAVLGITLSSVLGFAWLLLSLPKQAFAGLFRKTADKLQTVKLLLKISSPLTCAAAVISLSGIIDLSFIMNRLSDAGFSAEEASALYGNYSTLTVPLLGLLSALLSPISIASLPILTNLFSFGNRTEYLSSAKQTCLLFSFLSCPLAVGAYLYSREVLSLLFPDAGAAISSPLLKLISPAFVLFGCLVSTNLLLESSGRLVAPLISHIVGAAVKAAVSFLFIPSVGIAGAPIGTVVGYFFSLAVSAFFLLSNREIGLMPFRAVVIPLFCSIAAIYPTKILQNLLSPWVKADLLTLLILAVCAALYLLFSFFLLPTKVFCRNLSGKYPKKAYPI